MPNVQGPGGGTGRIDEAQRKALEAAAIAKAAEAAKAAAQAAEAAQLAAAKAQEAAREAAALADAGQVGERAGLEANAGPTGAKSLPALPDPPPGFEQFQGFGTAKNPATTAPAASQAPNNARVANGPSPVRPDGTVDPAAAAKATVTKINAIDPRTLTAAQADELVRLRAESRDPGVRQAVDALAAKLLDVPGGADARALAARPGIGKLLAPLAKSADPAVAAKTKEAVRGWLQDDLNRQLAGKTGKDDVGAAIDRFNADVRKLARDTGLGEAIGEGLKSVMERNKGQINDQVKEGMAWYEKVGNFFSDVVGSAMDVAGDVAKFTYDVAGDVVEGAASVTADVVRGGSKVVAAVADTTLKVGGEVANVVVDGAGKIAGAGLDAVGATEVAGIVRSATDKAGDLARDGLSAVGDVERKILTAEGELVGGAFDVVGQAANKGLDTVGAAANTGLDVVGEAIKDGLPATANRIADQVFGPQQAEFIGQIDGATGLVTNRLGKGDAVFIRGEVGADAGVGLYGGAKLSGGAVLGRDAQGNITLTMEAGLDVEGGVRAKFGGGVDANGVKSATKAEVGAAVTAGGKVKMTFKFDPENPADVARLKALIEPTPAKLALTAVNPLAVATFSRGAIEDAFKHNLASEEFSGNVGAKAGGKVSSGLPGVSAEAQAGVDGAIGKIFKRNRDGSTEETTFARASAKASASATALAAGGLGVEAGAGADAVISVRVKRDAQGNITGIIGEDGARTSSQMGLNQKSKSTNTLAEGERGIKETKTAVGAGRTTTQTVEHELTGPALAEATRRIGAGESATEVFRDLNRDPKNYREIKTTTTADALTLGFGIDIAAGASIGVKGSLSVGRSHTDVEKGGDASSLHTDMATHAMPFGGSAEPIAPGSH